MENSKVLVTGADGFIGSHLTEAMVRKGYKVRALSYYNSFNNWGWLEDVPPEILKEVEVISGDIRDSYCVRKAVKDCELIMHLAALIAIPYSYESPDSYVSTNIIGTLNILNAARDYEVKKIVHTSTSEVYGTALYVPIDESHPLQAQSPYSATKIGADQLALSFYKSFNTPVSIIRPFNTYGPRQSARAIISTIISQLASGSSVVKLGSLKPTRDFTYVADTAAGFIKMAECKKSVGEVINLGSNSEISIEDLVKLISKIMNIEAEIIEENIRKRPNTSEVERLWSNNTKAKEILDWEPKYFLQEGLYQTIKWFKNIENLKRYKTDIYNF